VRLPDGAVLTVRAVTPADVDGVEGLYDGLSDDDRYRRFFSGFRPPRPFFERLTTVVDRGGYGVVASLDDAAAPGAPADGGSRIVGEASYEVLPNGDGELGMAVAADQRGWLGPFLLDALAEAAASRGVPNLEADVLVTNSRMLTLLRSRGYATVDSDDWSALRLVVGTAGHTPTWPLGGPGGATDDRPRVLVEAPGGRWHAEAEAGEAGLQVVACSGPGGTRRPRCPVLAGRPCPLAAGADAIVVSNVPDDDRWHAIVGAHADLHPGVPVCVEPRTGPAGRPPFSPKDGDSAVVIDDEDPRAVVALVDRLAAAHHRTRDAHRARPDGDPRP
jgi:hypothetical protein